MNETKVMPEEENAEGSVAFAALKEQAERHRQWQYWVAFVSGVSFSVLLTIEFMYFVWHVVEKGVMDWHIMFLGSALILPATFILYLLVSRSSPSRKGEKQEPEMPFPAERLAEGVAQLLESIAGMIKK